jgi:acetyl-CoA synthetase
VDSYGGNVLRNLERAGFEGPVWGVNPRRDEVLGRPCVPAVADLPEPVDALVIAVPAVGVADVVREGAELGCGGAIVLSAGFAEVESGRGFQDELRAVALDYDLPVCGPNGNGIAAVGARAMLWGDRLPDLEPGPIAMVTQSGNVGVNALGSRRAIRWHTVVSTGNQAVCGASDWLAALARRDSVRSVALFLESDDDGPALVEALAVCVEQGVGVAVLKVGASEGGARAASAHTGALAGDQRVFRALIEEAGGAWAEDLHDLLELAKALAEPRSRPRGDGGLAVLTCSGGDSGVAADQAAALGIDLPQLSPRTTARLRELLPDAATIANPLDYTAMIWGDAALLREIVSTVAADEAIVQLLLLYDHPADADESWASVRQGLIAGARDGTDAAALVASTLPDLLDERAALEFSAAGLPAVAGLRSALLCARALCAPSGDSRRLRQIAGAARRPGGTGGAWVSEVEAKRIVAAAGVQVPEGGEARDLDGCLAVAGRIGWPVALKLAGPAIQHKAVAGALALGLRDEAELANAYRRLASAAPALDADSSLLVERMEGAGLEVIVSARADAVVPALVVGLGGTRAEALDDVAIVPLPADCERIARAIANLRGAALLTDAIESVARVAERIGSLLLESGMSLIELNPVSVRDGRAVALDAIARR